MYSLGAMKNMCVSDVTSKRHQWRRKQLHFNFVWKLQTGRVHSTVYNGAITSAKKRNGNCSPEWSQNINNNLNVGYWRYVSDVTHLSTGIIVSFRISPIHIRAKFCEHLYTGLKINIWIYNQVSNIASRWSLKVAWCQILNCQICLHD